MTTPNLSFEFFPPKTDAQTHRFWRTLGCLETLQPEWFSVTYGALGSASEASMNTLKELGKDKKIPVAAHLTCAGLTRADLEEILRTFKSMGINHIVALRGDNIQKSQGEKYYHLRFASELVEMIAATGDFDISVAAYPEVHPEAESPESDMAVLKHKFDLGASRALTQFFFEPTTYLRWRDNALSCGIDKPLVPGILPIHDIQKVIDFSKRCGATVPARLVEQFQKADTEQSRRALAIEHSVELCKTLQDEGVDSFHLYTLNQSDLAFEVGSALTGVKRRGVAAA